MTEKTDTEYIKEQMKAIMRAKKAGNHEKAQRLADDLVAFLGV